MTPKFKETKIGLIPEDWEIKDVEEVCKLYRESFQPTDDDIRPYIGLEHIKENSLTLNGIGTSKDVKSGKLVFKEGQILFGKLRPYFRKVYRPDFSGVCSTDIFVIENKKGYNNGFLFYFFADPMMIEEAKRSSEGTRMPRASWKYLTELKRPFPPIEEQKLIANFLSSIDQKIELNQCMNQTLEEIGRAIFKHWFVDFEFPNEQGRPYTSSGGEMVDSELGEIPKGWEVKEIGTVIETIGGGTPSTKKEEYWENGNIQWFSPRDITANRQTFIFKSEKRINKLGLGKSSANLFPAYSVMMTSRATVGELSINTEEACTNQGFITCIPNDKLSTYCIYFWIEMNKENIIGLAGGSTFREINKSTFRSLKVIVPSKKVLLKYNSILNPIFGQIEDLQAQNNNLSQIRDSLLPKLMSSKIRTIR